MKLYLFQSAPAAYANAFKVYYQQQNIKSLRLLARIILGITLCTICSDWILDYGKVLKGYSFYVFVNYFFCISSALVLLLDYLLKKEVFRNGNRIYSFMCLAYSFVVAHGCLLMSVAYQGNPINNMTMYLLGLIAVALFWVLELTEVLVLIGIVEVIYVVGVYSLKLSQEQLIANHIGSVLILILFFLLSRLNYTFRVNHLVQLKQIEEKNQELHVANKAKTEILGVVAHDLRAPFANIEMLTAMLRKKNLSAENEEKFFDMILLSCRNSRGIINDLLEMARYEQEENYPLEKTNFNDFLAQVHAQWQVQLKDSRKLQFQKPDQPLFVNLNDDKFRRVMDNLLSNAVKFTKENGLICISLSQKKDQVLLHIADDGIGIPEHLQQHLFTAFSKAGRKGVRGERSVGLGLSITRRLVEQHEGAIEVESAEHQGTTFSISLPSCS